MRTRFLHPRVIGAWERWLGGGKRSFGALVLHGPIGNECVRVQPILPNACGRRLRAGVEAVALEGVHWPTERPLSTSWGTNAAKRAKFIRRRVRQSWRMSRKPTRRWRLPFAIELLEGDEWVVVGTFDLLAYDSFELLGVVEIVNLGVALSHHNRKIGYEALKAVMDWCSRLPIDYLVAAVFQHNQSASRLFQKLGFQGPLPGWEVPTKPDFGGLVRVGVFRTCLWDPGRTWDTDGHWHSEEIWDAEGAWDR